MIVAEQENGQQQQNQPQTVPEQQDKWVVPQQRGMQQGAASKLIPKTKVGFLSRSDRDLGGTTVVPPRSKFVVGGVDDSERFVARVSSFQ